MSEGLEAMRAALSEAGLGQDAIETAEMLLEAGRTADLIRHLRLCRCGLMDDLHETQRKVDRMDYLIRQAGKRLR